MSESGRVWIDAGTSTRAPHTPAPRNGPAPSKYARDPKIWTPLGALRDEIVRNIAQRLRAGEGYEAIAISVGISRKAGHRKCAEIAAVLGLSPEQSQYELDVEEVRRRAEAGETNSEIAAAMGRTTATVSQIRRKIGLGHGRQLRFTPQENAEVERRLMLGESTRAVAIAIGCEQADVSRRRQAIKHLIPTDLPPCECGKRRNHGGRCLAIIDPSFIRERLLAGHTAAAIARELGRSAQNLKPMYVQPVIDQLTAEGHVCPCGLPFGHQFVCAATNARRLVFSDTDRARAKHLVLQGVAIERVRADLGVTLFAARRLVEGLRAELAAQGTKCPCGLAIDHGQTCTMRNGSARLAGQFRFRSAAAQTMLPPLRRKVSALARTGWPISAIVARAGETEWRVTQLVDELGAAGFLPTTCRGCDQPYRHKGPCPQPKLCKCGRPRKHRGLCRAADGRKRVPYTMLPPEQIVELKKRFRARMSINAIARATGVPLSVVQRLVKRWREHPGCTAKTCACGRPAFHPGGCLVNTPGAVGKRLVTRIEAGVLAGRPMRAIADDLDLTPTMAAQHSLPARERLFARGETCACGRIIGHPHWCSAKWDEFSQPRGRRPLAPEIERRAVAALVRGEIVADIARASGVGDVRIWKLRRELSAADLAQRARVMRLRISQRGTEAGKQIMATIEAAVSRRIDPMVRDDVVGELYLAVMEGRIEVEEIGAAVRSFISRGLSQWQSAYAPRSLDAPLGNEGNRTLADYADDRTAIAHLDEIHIGAGG